MIIITSDFIFINLCSVKISAWLLSQILFSHIANIIIFQSNIFEIQNKTNLQYYIKYSKYYFVFFL